MADVTTDEPIHAINDDAFHGRGDPDFDPFGVFLADTDWDY